MYCSFILHYIWLCFWIELIPLSTVKASSSGQRFKELSDSLPLYHCVTYCAIMICSYHQARCWFFRGEDEFCCWIHDIQWLQVGLGSWAHWFAQHWRYDTALIDLQLELKPCCCKNTTVEFPIFLHPCIGCTLYLRAECGIREPLMFFWLMDLTFSPVHSNSARVFNRLLCSIWIFLVLIGLPEEMCEVTFTFAPNTGFTLLPRCYLLI